MKHKGTTIVKVLIVLVTVSVAIGVLPWLFTLIFSQSPPQPEVTYGEFPFEIVFEINGETKTVDDVYVCEYDGIGVGSNGKYIKWKGYIKSTGDEYIVLEDRGFEKLVCSVGSPYYYMNDTITYRQQNEPKPSLKICYIFGVSFAGDSVEQQYGVKVLDYSFSQPIKNTFK